MCGRGGGGKEGAEGSTRGTVQRLTARWMTARRGTQNFAFVFSCPTPKFNLFSLSRGSSRGVVALGRRHLWVSLRFICSLGKSPCIHRDGFARCCGHNFWDFHKLVLVVHLEQIGLKKKRFLMYQMSSMYRAAGKNRANKSSEYSPADWERRITQNCSRFQDQRILIVQRIHLVL